MPDFKTKYPWYVFLFPVYSILFLYQHNIEQIPVSDLPLPVLLVVSTTALFFFGIAFLSKKTEKAALLVFLFSVLFFTYGHLYIELEAVMFFSPFKYARAYVLTGYILLFIFLMLVTIRSHKKLTNLTAILNIVTLGLALLTLVQISIFHIRNYSRTTPKGATEFHGTISMRPDIYYIIYDTFPSFEVLNDFFRHDTSDFSRYLESKGFYIAKKSTSNYLSTELSLATSLNMQYPPKISNKRNTTFFDLGEMIDNSKVLRLLKSAGYKTIHYSSGSVATMDNPYADENIYFKKQRNRIISYLFEVTLLRIILYKLKHFKSYIIPQTFDHIIMNAGKGGPKFVFAHFLSPHPPFIFTPEGKAIDDPDSQYNNWNKPQKFIDEVRYLERKNKEMIDAIISKSHNSVIIIQGDHGSRMGVMKRPRENLFELSHILNAIRIPKGCSQYLYESMSPVNTFRVVFNCLFDTDYGILPDETYLTLTESPFTFRKISKDIKQIPQH